MADFTLSPNMSMPVPTVATAPGPGWASNLDASLSIVDSHNHSSGQGVEINPAGLNINSDLSFNNNNATVLRSVNFTSQAAPLSLITDIGCLYVSGVDLYYNDEGGTQIRITQGGAVAGATGTITGLPSGTASASYSAGTFTFQSATNTPASMNVGPIVLGNNTLNSKAVTIAPNSGIASNYNLTLPAALPGALNYVTLDASGNLSFNSSGVTGSNAVVLATMPTLNNPSVSNGITFPSGTMIDFAEGTYTPVFTGGISAPTGPAFYQRVGYTVSVRMLIEWSGSSHIIGSCTLPIAPNVNFINDNNVKGTISSDETSVIGLVTATSSAQTAQLLVVGPGSTNEASCVFFYYLNN
jgi:hypothetical protein